MSSRAALPVVDDLAWDLFAMGAELPEGALADAARIARAARSLGEEAAAGYDPRVILRDLGRDGVVISREERGAGRAHADYWWEGERAGITLYERPIAQIASAAAEAGIGVDARAIEDAHVAHEFFHHLARTGRVDARPPEEAPRRPLARLRVGRRRHAFEELAAHAFARAACDLPVHPVALDWLLVSQEDEDAARSALELAARRANMLEGTHHEKH